MNSNKQFKGVISALPTPFVNKEVDYNSLTKLVEYQLKNGINGFVVNGTTAESPTLTWEEVEKIYYRVREISAGQVPTILGTGSNSTQETINKTQKAEKLKADGVLVVVPYYNKPPQRGLVAHFTEVAANTQLPIIMYNVPGRTITAMTSETIVELAKVKNLCALKEASGDLKFDELLKKQLPEGFSFLTGDDPTYIGFLKLGGHGVISVMSNIITKECALWTNLASQQKWSEAEASFGRYNQLISQMYVEANPIPLKWILYKKGIFQSPEARLPLVALDEKYYAPLAAELEARGLI